MRPRRSRRRRRRKSKATLPEPGLKPAPRLVPPTLTPPDAAVGTGPPAARRDADARHAGAAATARRGRDIPARRPHRRLGGQIHRGFGQGRIAHAPRNRARRLAALRLPDRRDLGQGRRADPVWPRLDRRARSQVQARHGNGLLRLAAVLRRREQLARQRGGDPVRGPRSLRSLRRALHDVRRAARGLVPPHGRARGRQDADGRHRPRRDGLFLRRAGPLFAVVRVSAVERAQVRVPHADDGPDRHSRLRIRATLLPQSRSQLRCDDHAAPHDQARPADRRRRAATCSRTRRAKPAPKSCRTIA